MRRDPDRAAAQAIRRDPNAAWADRPIIHAHTRRAATVDELPTWLRRLLNRARRGV